MVKKCLLFIFLSFSVFSAHKAYLKEDTILNTEVGSLIIITDSPLKGLKVPKIFGFNWLRTSHVLNYSNGKHQYKLTFSVDDIGDFTIPAFDITFGGKVERVKALNFVVLEGRKLGNKLQEHFIR